jgi:Lrp/AsnC family leucine-responsive transcriptional regulator
MGASGLRMRVAGGDYAQRICDKFDFYALNVHSFGDASAWCIVKSAIRAWSMPAMISDESLTVDAYDRRILAEIQQDASIGPAELSHRVHLSASQCSRRLQRLRERGLVDKAVTLLDARKLNLGIHAILLIRLGNQSAQNEQGFLRCVQDLPEVTACHYVTGDLDFILHVATRDLESYETLLRQRLLPSADIRECRTNIVLRTNKATTELPLTYL